MEAIQSDTFAATPEAPKPITLTEAPGAGQGGPGKVQGERYAAVQTASSAGPAGKRKENEESGQSARPQSPPSIQGPVSLAAEESVRSEPQEAYSYVRELPMGEKEKKQEGGMHIKRKVVLMWTALKMKAKYGSKVPKVL